MIDVTDKSLHRLRVGRTSAFCDHFTTVRLLPALLLLLPLSGCSKLAPRNEESVYQDMIRQCDELSALLLKISGASSGKERIEQIKQYGSRLKELKAQKDQYARQAPTPEAEELRKKYNSQLSASIGRVVAQHDRLRNLTSAKEAADEVHVILQTINVKAN